MRPGGTSILVVDHDVLVRQKLKKTLQAAGYQTALANDGRQGMQTYLQLWPDLMICDLWLPLISGARLALVLRQLDPGLKAIFLAGPRSPVSGNGELHSSLARLGFPIMAKPVSGPAIVRQVGLAFASEAATNSGA